MDTNASPNATEAKDTDTITPTTFAEYQEIAAQIVCQQAVLRAVGKPILQKAFQDFLAEHPEIVSLSWPQYSNYFNDGDECPFEVRRDDLLFTFEDDSTYQCFLTTDTSTNAVLWNQALDILGAFADDDLDHYFGNHSLITITREGIERSYYEHD